MDALQIRAAALLLLLSLSPHQARAQETFKFPANAPGVPVSYLEKMKVKDTSRRLSDAEKHALCRLFTQAYVISVRRHGQDYTLRTSAPVYRLLVANFPDLAAREGEEGTVIFLAAVVKFFNSSSAYKPDVLRVLREGLDPKYCGL